MNWITALAALLMLFPQAAQQDAKAGIQFSAPAGWTVNTQAGRTVMAAPDGAVTMIEWAPAATTLDDAAKVLEANLGDNIKQAVVANHGTPTTFNGMQLVIDSGSGQVAGAPVVWEAYILQGTQPVIVLTFGAPAGIGKHVKDINHVYDSLKKNP